MDSDIAEGEQERRSQLDIEWEKTVEPVKCKSIAACFIHEWHKIKIRNKTLISSNKYIKYPKMQDELIFTCSYK